MDDAVRQAPVAMSSIVGGQERSIARSGVANGAAAADEAALLAAFPAVARAAPFDPAEGVVPATEVSRFGIPEPVLCGLAVVGKIWLSPFPEPATAGRSMRSKPTGELCPSPRP